MLSKRQKHTLTKPWRLLSYLPWTASMGIDMPWNCTTIQDVVHALRNFWIHQQRRSVTSFLTSPQRLSKRRLPYYLELYADAVLTIKEQVRPTKRRVRGFINTNYFFWKQIKIWVKRYGKRKKLKLRTSCILETTAVQVKRFRDFVKHR